MELEKVLLHMYLNIYLQEKKSLCITLITQSNNYENHHFQNKSYLQNYYKLKNVSVHLQPILM